jgi:hypothetical protein
LFSGWPPPERVDAVVGNAAAACALLVLAWLADRLVGSPLVVPPARTVLSGAAPVHR